MLSKVESLKMMAQSAKMTRRPSKAEETNTSHPDANRSMMQSNTIKGDTEIEDALETVANRKEKYLQVSSSNCSTLICSPLVDFNKKSLLSE